MRLFIIASRGTHSLELFCLWPAGLVCQRAEMMGPPCCSAIRAELHSSLNCFDKHSLTIFLCFHRFLVNLNTCPAGVLGWYRSPAKGPTPSTLYLLFFPALSDIASQVACYSLFSFISMFSYPSDLSPFFIFFCPVLHLLDLLYHPGSLISIPSSSSTIATTFLFPKRGWYLILLTSNDNTWEFTPHRFHFINGPFATPGDCKACFRGQRSTTAGLRRTFCLRICLPRC